MTPRSTFAVRRDVLSVGNELRLLAWVGVMLVAAGAGIVVTKRFADIGPLTVAAVIGAAAAACYAWAALRPSGPLSEYVVLLGALLISAELGFIEHQWHLLGAEWQRHFLVLAVAHAAAAYYFDSRAVLSLSVAALAAWFGIERQPPRGVDLAARSFACAGVVMLWRWANRNAAFTEIFEHFAANLAFWGALSLTASRDWRWIGVAVAVGFAAAAIAYGFRTRRELFVIYGYVYGAIAVDAAVLSQLHDITAVLYLFASTVAVIVAMIVTHFRMRA